jgi:signal transduction histidine kinase
MQRDVVLPSKAGIILVVFYFLFYSGWFYEVPTSRSVVQEMLKNFFLIYIFCNVLAAFLLGFWRHFPPTLFQWVAFTLGLLDGLFMAGLAIVTGGFDSVVFWLFPVLIMLNALTIPLAMPQIVLNLIVSLFYLSAGLMYPHGAQEQTAILSELGRSAITQHATNHVERANNHQDPGLTFEAPLKARRPVWSDELGENLPEDLPADNLILRMCMLWLLILCCYGAQVLWERQRIALEEAVEFVARENQLHSAGRLAAEFAHQIKNPLAVIHNAAYSLRRSLRNSNTIAAEQQIEIIQEEVARADRVITQIMGYAQLSEGRVEKLDVMENINQAIEQVFPAAVPTEIRVQKNFDVHFPPLLMQRSHLSEILVNLLQNAREALGERGNLRIEASCQRDHAIEITVADSGPGIAPDKIESIFEAYFTTKTKGTGLGLAIVKHNAELYSGSVRVDSALGKGTKFTVVFPAKAMPRPLLQ